ncbi:MAG TPA: FtsX-like permease family protein, partial [Ktedonobacteraceae bacterium]|nr:FtsX-like permease family protein [Ktedonobacteraceae bacterium]
SNDLNYFTKLQSDKTITSYTAVINSTGSLNAAASSFSSFTVEAVDPGNFPVVSQPTFASPANGSVSSLLTNNQVIVTQSFLDNSDKKIGDSFDVYIKSKVGSGETRRVTIAGVVTDTGIFAQSGTLLLVSTHDYQAAALSTPLTYSVIDVTTADQAHTDAAVKDINQHFAFATTQTVADALKSQQSSIDNISKFLEIAGLLALLIGGVGIVNTMQVLLSRRKTEIAMLKTTGYRRVDLYLLFGLEAGLLGLVGGIIGAGAATGVSYIARILVQNTGITIPFLLNPWTIAGGVAIGLVTALIFGLMPIAQAANIRPLNVVREQSENRGASSFALTIALLVILSILFCALAIVILNNDVLLGIEAVYGAFAFLLLLSVFFGLVVLIVSKLPVPERFNLKQLAIVMAGVVVSTLVYLALPVFGLIMLGISLTGSLVVLLPRTWKVSTKMALRNIGRQRARTTTTLLALFIGVFTVGLVLALGVDLQSQINSAFSQNLTYNVVATTSGSDTATLQSKLSSVAGLTKSRSDILTQVLPIAIDGQPLQQALPTGKNRQETFQFLGTVEGYNLAQEAPSLTLSQGRNLAASDVGTNDIVISDLLSSAGPFGMHLKPGDTVTFASVDGKHLQTATIVGIYSRSSFAGHVGSVLAPAAMVSALSPATTGATTITYMQIDSAQVNNALNTIGKIAPNASVQNLADIGAYIGQMLNNILDILVAIASLSVIAGVIIVANAVALAMLERRRELGILKSVGYTSSTVLSEVLIENGIVGGLGALLAALLAAAGVTLLGSLFFNLAFSISPLIVLSLVGGSALVAMLTAALVAWGSVRVRPLEVLRYE